MDWLGSAQKYGVTIAFKPLMGLRNPAIALILILNLFSVPVLGQPVDFFEPKLTADYLTQYMLANPGETYHEIRLGNGGEGEVLGVVERKGSELDIYALKKFFPGIDMKANVTALKLLTNMEAQGYLGDFKVIKFNEPQGRNMRLPLIEGQLLLDLLKNQSANPEFRKLWKRYQQGLRTFKANVEKLGYYTWHSGADSDNDCLSLVKPLTVYDTESILVFNDPDLENAVFSIESVNVMVEFGTGDFYIIDPI